MMKKKVLCCLLGAILAVTLLAGCGGEETANENGVPQVHLFMNNGAISGGSLSNQKDLDMVRDKIIEEIGIEPVLINASSGSEDEKLNVMLASNERIDAFWGQWPEYASDGVIVPINDALAAEGEDIKKVVFEEVWTAFTDENGSIWGVPRSPAMTTYPTFVRKDWLDMYGLSAPTNLQELEAVLKAFKENDPAGNNNTIPLVVQYAGIKRGLSAAFTGHGYGHYIDTDGKVKPSELHPGYKDMVAKLAEWYQKGYIDREGFTVKQAQVREQIKQNRVGMHMDWYSNVTIFEPDLALNHPDAKYEIANWEGPAGKAETVTNLSAKGMLVTKRCEAPENVIKLMNWGHKDMHNYNILQSGIEGVHWEYGGESGKSVTSLTPDAKTYSGDYNFALGFMEYQMDPTDPTLTVHSKYLLTDILNYDRAVKGIDFDVFYDQEVLSNDIPMMNDISRMMEEETIRFITGARDISEWDEFIDDLYTIGMDTYIEVYTREYNKLTQ